jgi:hypothetical protein
MKRRGSESAPFQIFIGIVVFGMALAIGAYLFDMVNCWKCDELLKAEVTTLRESIASVGKGDTNSRDNLLIKLEDLGYCAKGIYLRHITTDSGLNCQSFCPQHPNSCWVVVSESRCGGGKTDMDCIDISGSMGISACQGIDIGTVTSSDDSWIQGSDFAITHTVMISIEKTGPNELELCNPGGSE